MTTEDGPDKDGMQRRVAGLVELALTKAEEDLRCGTPAVRQKVYGTLLPTLLKELGDQDRDEQLDELKVEQRRLFDLFQSRVAGSQPVEAEAPPIPEDAPPAKAKRSRRPSSGS